MIGFAGLSHLGIVSSIAAAAVGQDVVGYDPDTARVEQLASGQLPVIEPGLTELFAAQCDRLNFRASPAALERCDLIYCSIDVPTDADNRSDPSTVRRLIDRITKWVSPSTILVILSQVPPGFTRQLECELGEAFPDKKLRLFYQVETLVFGRALERAMHPERYILGCLDPTQPLPARLEKYLRSWSCPIIKMRYESAELAKIAINLFLVSSVTVTNTLAELCEAIGADWNEITPSLKLDRRIGPHAYLSPGLGLSGGNLERDLLTVKNLAYENGTEASIIDSWMTNSTYRRDWVLKTLHAEVLSKTAISHLALWGMAYKPDTHSVKNSPALALLEALRDLPVWAYDPQVILDKVTFPNVHQVDTPLEACRGAGALVIMTPWSVFGSLEPEQIRSALSGEVVIDPFGVLRQVSGLRYHRLGVNK